MQITVGQTRKRINSTSRVIYGGGTTLTNVKVKEPCSMQSPIFKVQGLSKEMLFNYLKWEADDFDRYYWVDDVVYINRHIQEIHCHLDPLATFRDAIDSTRAFVKYGDSSHWNTYIDDYRFSPEKRCIGTGAGADNMSVNFRLFEDGDEHGANTLFDTSSGTIIMNVMDCGYGGGAEPHTTTYGVHTYAMNFTAFKCILNDLTGWMDGLMDGYGTITGSVVDVMQFLTKMWGSLGGEGSWRDNILSCIYLPIKIDAYAVGNTDIYADGIWIGGVLSYPNPLYEGHIYEIGPQWLQKTSKAPIEIPWSYQARTYEFMKNPRWGSIQIGTPAGYQEISLAGLHDKSSVTWNSILNIATGEWSGKLIVDGTDDGQILAAFSGNISMDLLGYIGSGASMANTLQTGMWTAITAAAGAPVRVQEGTAHIKSSSATETTKQNGDTSYNVNETEKDVPVYRSESSGISGIPLSTGVHAGCASGAFGSGMTGFYLVDSYIRGYSSNIGGGFIKMIAYAPDFLITGGQLNQKYENFCNLYGYPCNDFVTLQDINGYCCCVGASVENARGASEANKATINSYLNSGIILEE